MRIELTQSWRFWLSVGKTPPFFLDFGDIYIEAIQEQYFHIFYYLHYLKINKKVRLICKNPVVTDGSPVCPFWATHQKDFCFFTSVKSSVKEDGFLCPSALASLPTLSFLIYSLFLVIKPFCLAKWNYILCYLIYFATRLRTFKRHSN